MKNSSQVHQRKRKKFVGKTDRDHISTLPDELLYEILSKLPGKDVVRTSILSKRWVNLWKYTPNLNFSHRGILKLPIRFVQRTMNKVSHQCLKENENGRMIYASQQLDKGKVDVHVQKEEKNNGNVVFIIEMSHKRHSNYKFCFYQPTTLKPWRIYYPPNIVYLELHRYRIHPYLTMMFCESLKTLKLIWVFVETRLLNSILPQCVFLEELVIRHSYNIRDGLRIRNNRLKFLELSCIDADQIQVSGTHLEVLVLDHVSCPAKCFELNAPEIEFKGNYLIGPHIYTACNISSEVGETFSYIPSSVLETVGNAGVGYEVLINDSRTLRNVGTLAIKLDFKKQRKILILSDMLKECVCLRTLELKIKENKTAYEDEDDEDCPPWILRSKFWEKQAFPFLEGQLESVSINGFTGSIEETGFTACLVTKTISLKKLTVYFRPCAVQRATKAVMGLLALPKASKNLAVQLKPEACEPEILNDVANYFGSFGFR